MLEAPTVHEATPVAELVQRGFSPRGARHFAQMRRRYEEGEFADLAGRIEHLKFVIWLVDIGRLTDDLPDEPPLQLWAGTTP
jgi:hypothetical protein